MDAQTDPYASLHPALTAAMVDAWHLLPHTTGVSRDETFRNLHYLIDYVTDAVRLAFPEVPCRSGCAACCIDYGLPRTTAIEWALIHRYWQTDLSPAVRAAIVVAARRDYGHQVPQLLAERARIERPHTDDTVPALPIPAFTCLQCPFLIDGACSIYPVRPAICRAFGSFSIRVGDRLQAFTCQMAADQIQVALDARQVPHWALPLWGRFEERLYELNGGEVASLPLWLLAHLDGDELLADALARPDFAALAES